MIIKKFTAKGFRNIESCDVEFSPGVNLLLGDNAEGKTNALEGIYLFARGKSFRRAEEKDLVGFEKQGFHISLTYKDKERENVLEYSSFGRERRRRKNGYSIKSASEMIGSFRAVLFFPDDLLLVKAGPEARREFLNVGISQCFPAYIPLYKAYKNAHENRNALLKNASKGLYFDEGELISWGDILAEYSAQIYMYRKKYIERIEYFAKGVINDISEGKEEIEFIYKSGIDEDTLETEKIKEKYKIKYRENLEREKCAGTGLYGPSRDDIIINIGNSAEEKKDARSFASQGQQRSIVLAMKLAEGEVIKELTGEYPVYLFDDVLSELDAVRQKYVLSGKGEKQIIITSCDKENSLIKPDKIIFVKEGMYS